MTKKSAKKAGLSRPDDMTPEELSVALTNAKTLEAWINGVREYALEQALAGVAIPGFKLTTGSKQRYWKTDEKTADSLRSFARDHGIPTTKLMTFVSPKQVMEMLIANGTLPPKAKPADRDAMLGDFLQPKETFQYLRIDSGGSSPKSDFG